MASELYNAVLHGITNLAENSTVADPNKHLLQVTSLNNTILHVAAKLGKTKVVENVVDSKPSLVYETNIKGDTALHIASRLGNLEMTQLLIKKAKEQEGIEEGRNKLVRMANSKGDTALHEAVRQGRYKVSELLIKEDVELASVENKDGESPLYLAADRCYFSVALNILKYAPRCSYAGRKCTNALHAAVVRMHKSHHYITSTITNEQTSTQLCKFFPYIYRFICAGSKVPQSNYELGCKPYFLGTDFVGEMLKTFPSSMGETDDFGCIPLHYAAISGNVEVVELFLKNDASLAYKKNAEGMSALHLSAAKGHVDVVSKLIEKCPDTIDLLNETGQTALHIAVYFRTRNVVKFFRQTPFFRYLVNEQDNEGNTALHLAARNNDFKTLAMLADDQSIDKGAVNNRGLTAIHIIKSGIEFKYLDCFMANTILKLEKNGARTSLEWNFTKLTNEAAQRRSSGISKSEIMKEENRGREAIKSENMKEENIGREAIKSENMKEENRGREPIKSEIMKEENRGREAIKSETMKEENRGREAIKSEIMKEENRRREAIKSEIMKEENRRREAIKSEIMKEENRGREAIKDAISINLLVDTIIATVTFAAAITMPGGYDDKGTAISWKRIAFKGFILFDSLSFGFSAGSLLIHYTVGARPGLKAITYRYGWVNLLSVISIFGMVISFVLALLVVIPGKSALAPLAIAPVLFSCFIPYFYHVFRNIFFREYYIYQIREKPSRPFISFVGRWISDWKRVFGFD